MRLKGSILPKMLVPLICIGLWSTAIVYIIQRRPEFAVSNTLMNTLGFVVALALSFRSQTAYERYGDGRRAWTRLSHEARNLARIIWLHTKERNGELGKKDLLSKMYQGTVNPENKILPNSPLVQLSISFQPLL